MIACYDLVELWVIEKHGSQGLNFSFEKVRRRLHQSKYFGNARCILTPFTTEDFLLSHFYISLQESIRASCQDCTVITIAHRLNTVIDYDRILVLEDGKIVEFDEPEVLLSKEDGYFAELYRNYCTKQTAET